MCEFSFFVEISRIILPFGKGVSQKKSFFEFNYHQECFKIWFYFYFFVIVMILCSSSIDYIYMCMAGSHKTLRISKIQEFNVILNHSIKLKLKSLNQINCKIFHFPSTARTQRTRLVIMNVRLCPLNMFDMNCGQNGQQKVLAGGTKLVICGWWTGGSLRSNQNIGLLLQFKVMFFFKFVYVFNAITRYCN